MLLAFITTRNALLAISLLPPETMGEVSNITFSSEATETFGPRVWMVKSFCSDPIASTATWAPLFVHACISACSTTTSISHNHAYRKYQQVRLKLMSFYMISSFKIEALRRHTMHRTVPRITRAHP
jgi:hypothetical protein